MRKADLLQLLSRLPGNPEVVVWQSETRLPVEGCESAIEQVIECDGRHGRVLVLGMDIPANDLGDAEMVWEGK